MNHRRRSLRSPEQPGSTVSRTRALHEAGLLAEDGTGVGSYGEAVWWTALMLTTTGSDYFPRSSEGRFIAWLLAT